jgi:predicted DsbA family dithiol-disulfide isomerase
MDPLRIDIVSDVVCPWCIIGYKQVERALTLLDQPVEAEFHWHPFELNPDMPPEGEDSAEHIQRKYGRSAEQGKAVRSQIRDTAASLGFAFGEGGARRVVNTFAAHKLLTKTGEVHGWQKQTALKLALFAAYFQTGLDVSDGAVLLDIAESVRLDRDETQRWLADDALAGKVRGELAYWREENISGVPAIIFDGAFMVPGAQSVETFAQVIQKVLAKRAA